MEFLDISSLGATYQYATWIEKKIVGFNPVQKLPAYEFLNK